MDHEAADKDSQGDTSDHVDEATALTDDGGESVEVVQSSETRGNARQRVVNAARQRIERLWEERRLREQLDDAFC